MHVDRFPGIMAAELVQAQHFVECDECENNPAKFVCKTCPGNLCDKCKTEHGNRKISKNHEITEFNTEYDDLVDFLYCSDHKTKKLECFCDPCKKPVCTDCIVSSHNGLGHAVKALSETYKDIKKDLQAKKEEIDKNLLPKYREMLAKEALKKSDLSKQADQVQKQIESHTLDIIEMVKDTAKKIIEDLRSDERKGIQEIDESSNRIQKTIQKLQVTEETLSKNIEGKPGVAFFTPLDSNLLEQFQRLPSLCNYILRDFQAGQITSQIERLFGKCPGLLIQVKL